MNKKSIITALLALVAFTAREREMTKRADYRISLVLMGSRWPCANAAHL